MGSTTTDHAKKLAELLREDLAAAGHSIPHSLALEMVAHQLGAKDWNTLAALIGTRATAAAPTINPGVPVLRVMSMQTALPFYIDYLGFTLDWEHQFEPGLPLYAQVSRSAATLHLSEHHGDGSPNGVVWFPVRDVVSLHQELLARPNARLRPGINTDAPGGPTLQVTDPYGNVLRFAQPPTPWGPPYHAEEPSAQLGPAHAARRCRLGQRPPRTRMARPDSEAFERTGQPLSDPVEPCDRPQG